MGKNLIRIIAAGLFFFALSQCKEKEEQFDYGYDYFPIEVGKYWIYDVIRTDYVTGIPDTDTFQIKEVVTDTFTIGGEFRYRLERYKRASGTVAWPVDPDSVWTAFVTTQKMVRVENNIRYVKLIFPVEKGLSWNGNVENSLGYDGYTLKNVGDPFQVKNGNSYAGTAIVMQEVDTSNIVDRDYRFEVFAKGIGLVYRSKEVHAYDQSTLGNYDIESGISYYESLNSYGNQ